MLAKFLICHSIIFTYSWHLDINQSHFWSLSVQSCFLLNYWQPVPWFDNCFNRWHCFKVARHDASHEMVRIVSFWLFNLAFMVMKWDFFVTQLRPSVMKNKKFADLWRLGIPTWHKYESLILFSHLICQFSHSCIFSKGILKGRIVVRVKCVTLDWLYVPRCTVCAGIQLLVHAC